MLSVAEKHELNMNVRRGIALLDKKRPHWRDDLRKAVKRSPLDVQDRYECVLGKLYGREDVGCLYLGVKVGSMCGFHHTSTIHSTAREEYAYLTELWNEEIHKNEPISWKSRVKKLLKLTRLRPRPKQERDTASNSLSDWSDLCTTLSLS